MYLIQAQEITLFLALLLAACGSAAPSPTPLPPTPVPAASPTPAPSPLPSATPAPPPSSTARPYIPPGHPIGVRQVSGAGEFYNRGTGETFVLRGANYVFVPHEGSITHLLLKVGVYDPARTREDFKALAAQGYNTVRVFLDHCSAGPGCIGDDDNSGLNPDYLDNIADMLAAAGETGLYILFTSNDLPDQGGYSEQANAASGEIFAGYRNSYYLTPEAVEATRLYWRDLLTGLNQREAATDRVLGWQLLNEQWLFIDQPPLSLTSGEVETTTGTYDMSDPGQKRRMVSDGLIHYIAEVKAEILAHDPTALVTMGFFAPEIAAPGWFVDTAPLLSRSDLDFFDFHGYPGGPGLEELAEAFGMLGYESKPIVLGEYGAFRHIYSELNPAARAITEWQTESCEYGFDGWLYWTYHPAGPAVDDRTWGFTDEAGYFMDLLSPANAPDPCVLPEIQRENLAFGAAVTASRSLPEEPPELAVDENENTQWGAGSDATQWIDVDLGRPVSITEIRLLVGQWPEGETVHRLRGRSAEGSFSDLHTFSGFTREGDWLVWSPEPPVGNIQIIRIETQSSPSWVAWKEIVVKGV